MNKRKIFVLLTRDSYHNGIGGLSVFASNGHSLIRQNENNDIYTFTNHRIMLHKALTMIICLFLCSCHEERQKQANTSGVNNADSLHLIVDSLIVVYEAESKRIPKYETFAFENDDFFRTFRKHSRINAVDIISDKIRKNRRTIESYEGRMRQLSESPIYDIKSNRNDNVKVFRFDNDSKLITLINDGDSFRIAALVYNTIVDQDTVKLKVISRIQKKMSRKQWDTFEQILSDAHYTNMYLNEVECLGGGEYWTIEDLEIYWDGRLGRYHKVSIFRPSGSLAEIGKYIMELSGL